MSSSEPPLMARTEALINCAGPNQSSAVEIKCGCKSSRFPPPCSTSLFSRHPPFNCGRKTSNLDSNRKILPNSPSLIIFLMVKASESHLRLKYVETPTPVCFETSIISSVSFNVRPIGLSTTTGIPAFNPAIACSA